MDTESNGAGTRYEYSDVWGGAETTQQTNVSAGVTTIQSGATVTVDALGDNFPWTGTAPKMNDSATALAPTAPPFIGNPATATDQMQGLAFPLVGTARSAASSTNIVPKAGMEVSTGTSVTRHWAAKPSGNLFGTAARSTPHVTIVTPATMTPMVIGTVAHGAIRRWGGIGGTVLTPSFPQLDKNTTSFPSAI